MGRKVGKWIGRCFFVISLIFVILMLEMVIQMYMIEKRKKKQSETPEAQELVIDTPKPCTYGNLTIVDEFGDISFQYTGDISIVNNGTNGEPIDIRVSLEEKEGR